MLLSVLITLTLMSFGTIVVFFALQSRIQRWRRIQDERRAYAHWSRLTVLEKTQALKKIGVFPLKSAAQSTEALDRLFVQSAAPSARGRLAHG